MSTYLIRATAEGFRRAGRAWPVAGERVRRTDFTDEQWAALEAEPRILIQHAPHDPAQGAETTREGADPTASSRVADGDPAPRRGRDPEAGPEPAAGDPQDDIAAAVGRVDPTDRSLWTRDGKPRVDAVEALLGRDITTAERDAAWAAREALTGA